MKDRIKELRKRLSLNQTEFGARIGLSQRAIATLEQGGSVTERNFNAICKAFSVNPEWLRNGEGEMFIETKETLIQSLVDEYKLDDDERILLRTFLALPKEHRAGVLKWAQNMAAAFAEREGIEFSLSAARKPDGELTPDERADMVRQESVDEQAARKRGIATSSASTGLSGTSKKFGTSP